jgi:hypothetical protein
METEYKKMCWCTTDLDSTDLDFGFRVWRTFPHIIKHTHRVTGLGKYFQEESSSEGNTGDLDRVKSAGSWITKE